MHEGYDKGIRNLEGGGDLHFGDKTVYWRIIQKQGERCGLDSGGSG